MKIRLGFVSNSSSSSFVLIGIKLTAEQKNDLFAEGSKNLFDVIDTPDGVFAGNCIAYDECLQIENRNFMKAFHSEKVDALKAAFNLTDDDLEICWGEYDR